MLLNYLEQIRTLSFRVLFDYYFLHLFDYYFLYIKKRTFIRINVNIIPTGSISFDIF